MTTTITQQINKLESLVLRGDDDKPIQAREVGTPVDEANKDYKYAKYLPYRHDDGVRYQPLTEYKHVDPGLEALKHEQPREFLNGATVTPVSAMPQKGGCDDLTDLLFFALVAFAQVWLRDFGPSAYLARHSRSTATRSIRR